jgi:hypothetical protein
VRARRHVTLRGGIGNGRPATDQTTREATSASGTD